MFNKGACPPTPPREYATATDQSLLNGQGWNFEAVVIPLFLTVRSFFLRLHHAFASSMRLGAPSYPSGQGPPHI